jgi:hypothetical protein
MSLAPALPSAPKVLGKYVFYYARHGESGNVSGNGVSIWAAPYAAKHVFNLMVNGRDWQWDKEGVRITCGDLLISCAHMDEVVSYEFKNDEERRWHVGEPDRSQLLRAIGVLAGPYVSKAAVEETQRAHSPAVRVARAPKPDGLVSIQDIAGQLGKDPGKCRAVLRKANVEKPVNGWAWADADVEGIKKILIAGLK